MLYGPRFRLPHMSGVRGKTLQRRGGRQLFGVLFYPILEPTVFSEYKNNGLNSFTQHSVRIRAYNCPQSAVCQPSAAEPVCHQHCFGVRIWPRSSILL